MREQVEILATKQWLEKIVIGLNFCPFAKGPFLREEIQYALCQGNNLEECLQYFVQVLRELDEDESKDTALIIYPGWESFEDYLDLLAIANDLLCQLGYEGDYQLASFHPNYCFDGVHSEDASNYTNRSPYPIIHILNEESLERALGFYKDAEQIPEKNIQKAREIGAESMAELLNSCS